VIAGIADSQSNQTSEARLRRPLNRVEHNKSLFIHSILFLSISSTER